MAGHAVWLEIPIAACKEFFLPQSGGHIDFSVAEKPGADIAEVSFQTADVSFGIRREEYSDYFHGYIDGGGFCNTNMVLSLASPASRISCSWS